MSQCENAEALRDYAFDELPAGERAGLEQHIAACAACAAELDQLRLTTAALRSLPDREIPQRIAFVSDKVFSPSPVARFFSGFWNSAARLGFASSCAIAAALIVSAWHRPKPEIRMVAGPAVDVSKQVNEAVAKAVAQVREEDARLTKAALAAEDRKNEQEHLNMMEAVRVLQRHIDATTLLASSEAPQTGLGQ
ncbi:MAG TPA: zf-HC2 domain-containing protein [Bryobacteraceae bacterium]|jgi:hypothetical protein|nr:zf-HC2 domain-containing protein [Bryobacteraceae bacterium]